MVDSSSDKDTVVVVWFEVICLIFGEVFPFLLSIFGKESTFSILYEVRIWRFIAYCAGMLN